MGNKTQRNTISFWVKNDEYDIRAGSYCEHAACNCKWLLNVIQKLFNIFIGIRNFANLQVK